MYTYLYKPDTKNSSIYQKLVVTDVYFIVSWIRNMLGLTLNPFLPLKKKKKFYERNTETQRLLEFIKRGETVEQYRTSSPTVVTCSS